MNLYAGVFYIIIVVWTLLCLETFLKVYQQKTIGEKYEWISPFTILQHTLGKYRTVTVNCYSNPAVVFLRSVHSELKRQHHCGSSIHRTCWYILQYCTVVLLSSPSSFHFTCCGVPHIVVLSTTLALYQAAEDHRIHRHHSLFYCCSYCCLL